MADVRERCKYDMKKDRKNFDGKGFIAEFRKFIMRGNVLDMAVGVIAGGTDFSYLTVTLGSGENAPVLNCGNFITAVRCPHCTSHLEDEHAA